MAFMGIDIGTGGCKCSVYDEDGVLYGTDYREYSAVCRGGHHELDSSQVWESIKTVIRSAIRKSPGQTVEAVCSSSLGEACVPVDRSGRILGNAMVYTDSRGACYVDDLCEKVGRTEIGLVTGVTPNKMFALSKVMWMRDHRPELFSKVYKFLQFEDFVTFMLSGETVVSYALASRTMAFDVVHKCWSQRILDAAGISPDLFSTPRSTGTIVGTVRPKIAKELGLPSTTKVVVGAQDQICAAVGCGILKPGQAANSMGSTQCITPVFDHPVINETTIRSGYACCPHATDGMYATYAYTFSGGSIIRWFRDTLARREFQEAVSRGESVYSRLDGMIGKEPSSLLVLPHFTGAAAPYMDDASRGMIAGLSLDTTLPELYRAFLEGISFEMSHSLDTLKSAGVPIDFLRACGGGAHSREWLQMQSDIYRLPIQQLKNAEAGTTGCIMIAGVATGAFRNLEEAASVYLDVGAYFEPDESMHLRYMEKYEQFQRLYQAGKAIFQG
ncbi:FGGY-family carbohydrate kinase [Marasmitruncus massiliensis]|uniref:FGGY-family carbohydrate kinase n=1 Tax=Marasmitruncus massiliensis TaxID=1944642 RepID=UPI000C7B53A3|nr:FGGY-family carbohydrate kinase [Marasmitruncus massiliensis]